MNLPTLPRVQRDPDPAIAITVGHGRSSVVQLAKLASFHPGYPLKNSQIDADGAVVCIRQQDFDHRIDGDHEPGTNAGLVCATPHLHARVRIRKVPAHQRLHAGDVILRAHAQGFAALLHDPLEPDTPAVCALPLLAIRIADQAQLSPAYLCWFLHTSTGQQMLARFARQGSLMECAIEGLHAVSLHLPSMAQQQKIVALDAQARSNDAQAEAVRQKLKHNMEAMLLAMAEEYEPRSAAGLNDFSMPRKNMPHKS
jgi:hypothetical protein